MYSLESLILLLLACMALAQDIAFPGEVSNTRPSRPGRNRGNDRGSGSSGSSSGSGSCSSGQRCVQVSRCPFSSFGTLTSIRNCTVDSNTKGVCCGGSITASDASVGGITEPGDELAARSGFIVFPEVSTSRMNRFGQEAEAEVAKVDSIENELHSRNLLPGRSSLESFHQNFLGNNPVANRINRESNFILQAAVKLAKALGLTPEQAMFGLRRVKLDQTNLGSHCPQNQMQMRTTCARESKFRTADGSCNNPRHQQWGQAMQPFGRLLPPEYSDRISAPRKAKSGAELPSARILSLMYSSMRPQEPETAFTLLMMQWGQFIDHDFTLTASTRTSNGSAISCCSRQILENPQLKHPACLPIDIPQDDPFYSQFRQTCMNFVRSAATVQNEDCGLGVREQLNQLTTYIDGSMIYGSSATTQRALRAGRGGLMRVSQTNNGELLPFETATGSNSTCNIPTNLNLQCFRAGDARVNENIDLPVLQTAFLREHNRIANLLSTLNPRWNDERLFEETRRIIGALLQHITYNEFLPVILGPFVMERFGLRPQQQGSGFINVYNPEVSPAILSAFATAAFRMHSLVAGRVSLISNRGENTGALRLSDTFQNPSALYRQGLYDQLINGMTTQSSPQQDATFSDQITNHLFRPFNAPFGLDLFSINVQRGRDHGIPDYNRWRQACGLQPVTSWRQLARILQPGVAESLSQIYQSVDDVDLFVAGVAEQHLQGALVGPTFACIIAEQFKRFKQGDRFFYENGGMASSFTQGQLDEIRQSSMAAILCNAGNRVTFMQPFAMIQPIFSWNEKIPCEFIYQMDLRQWRE